MEKNDLVKFRSECLSAHNFYRSLHATTPLIWSTRLADGAQKWAEQLASADSLCYSHERGVGENIACLWGSDVTGNKVTQIWYEEAQHFDYSEPKVTPITRPFCQVIWKATRELGAGKATTKNGKQIVVARYNPAASRRNAQQNVKHTRVDKIDGSSGLVLGESLGLRKFQEECLFAHNEFRVLHGASPLHWSPSLAWAAQQWAEELVRIGELKHNDDEMVGENLAGMVGDELTGKECTDMWYDEVSDYDYENPGYTEDTSNFTQVVWIGSELFGVGRATFGDLCVVVAFYEPPGNMEGLFHNNVRRTGTKINRLVKENKTFIPPSPDLDWFRVECLVAHNYFRARHAATPLIIAHGLNEEAQYWAERLLVTGATEDLQESRIGINVAVIEGHHVSGLKVTEMWYQEGTNYDYSTPGFHVSTRSFTQMIWLTSRKFGIGKASSDSGQIVVVARYEPVGNIDGLFVSNVKRRGHERNSTEPIIFETDVKYRIKVEGRQSLRMSWEIEGAPVTHTDSKYHEKTRLVWIESPVLPRKQMRDSSDMEKELDKSDEDKESGVDEGEDFEQEGTEPEPEDGRVLSRVAYFEQFEKMESEQKTEQAHKKTAEHEETVCELEYDDVFPKHDEHDEREDDFASEEETEEDDDDGMSLETVSEADEDLLEELLDGFEMDHHIKSYCYEVNYVPEQDDQMTDIHGERATEIEIRENLSPDHCVCKSVNREAAAQEHFKHVDHIFEFIPLEVEKQRKEIVIDNVDLSDNEHEKELKFHTDHVKSDVHSRPVCIEEVVPKTRETLEHMFDLDELFASADKVHIPQDKPPPTLPKPQRNKDTTVKTIQEPLIYTERMTEAVPLSETSTSKTATEENEISQETEKTLVEDDFSSEGEILEVIDVMEINRERKAAKTMNRLGRTIELIPLEQANKNGGRCSYVSLCETDEEKMLFDIFTPSIVEQLRGSPIDEELITAVEKQRNLENEIPLEELFKEDDEISEEEPADGEPVSEHFYHENVRRSVSFNETVVIVHEHETVREEPLQQEEEDYEYCEEESEEDLQTHQDQYEEATETTTGDLKEISAGSSVFLSHEIEKTIEMINDTCFGEGESAESFEEEDVAIREATVDNGSTPAHLSETCSEQSSEYKTWDIDENEDEPSQDDVYEETSKTKTIDEDNRGASIHVTAEIETTETAESDLVEEKSVRSSMYDSFEEIVPEAISSDIVVPSSFHVTTEVQFNALEVLSNVDDVKVDKVSSDEESEIVENVLMRGIPEATKSTVCITTETICRQRTELIHKRAPSIETETYNAEDEIAIEEATSKEILPNGRCTSAYISHDLEDATCAETVETQSESFEEEILVELDVSEIAVREVLYDDATQISVSTELKDNVNLQEAQEKPLSEFIGEFRSDDDVNNSYYTDSFSFPVHEIREMYTVDVEKHTVAEKIEGQNKVKPLEEIEKEEEHKEGETEGVCAVKIEQVEEQQEEPLQEDDNAECSDKYAKQAKEVENNVEKYQEPPTEEIEQDKTKNIEEIEGISEYHIDVVPRDQKQEEPPVEAFNKFVEELNDEEVEETAEVTELKVEVVEEEQKEELRREDAERDVDIGDKKKVEFNDIEKVTGKAEVVEQIEEEDSTTDFVQQVVHDSEEVTTYEAKVMDQVEEENEKPTTLDLEAEVVEQIEKQDSTTEVVEQVVHDSEEVTTYEATVMDQVEEENERSITLDLEEVVNNVEEIEHDKAEKVEGVEVVIKYQAVVVKSIEDQQAQFSIKDSEQAVEQSVEDKEKEVDGINEVTQSEFFVVNHYDEQQEKYPIDQQDTDNVKEIKENTEKNVEKKSEILEYHSEIVQPIENQDEVFLIEDDEQAVNQFEKVDEDEGEKIKAIEEVEKYESDVVYQIENQEETIHKKDIERSVDTFEDIDQGEEEEIMENEIITKYKSQEFERVSQEQKPQEDEQAVDHVEDVDEDKEGIEESTKYESQVVGQVKEQHEKSPIVEQDVEDVEEIQKDVDNNVEKTEKDSSIEEDGRDLDQVELQENKKDEPPIEDTVQVVDDFEKVDVDVDEDLEKVKEVTEYKCEMMEQIEEQAVGSPNDFGVVDGKVKVKEIEEVTGREAKVVEQGKNQEVFHKKFLEQAVDTIEKVDSKEEGEFEEIEKITKCKTQEVEEFSEKQSAQEDEPFQNAFQEDLDAEKQNKDIAEEAEEAAEHKEPVDRLQNENIFLQPKFSDDRFGYISEEELEETEELYATLRESSEEPQCDEKADENVYIQQTAAAVIHIASPDNEKFEPSEDDIAYDSEVITEVEKEITSVLVVKESFSSPVYDDESENEKAAPEDVNIGKKLAPQDPLVQFVDEDIEVQECVESFEEEEAYEEPPDVVQESEDVESSDETYEEQVQLIQFGEEVEEVVRGFERDETMTENAERSASQSFEDQDEMDSSVELEEENVELIQFSEKDNTIDETSYKRLESPSSDNEEKGSPQENVQGNVELIQFSEQDDNCIVDVHEIEKYEASPEEIPEKNVELIQFSETAVESIVEFDDNSKDVLEESDSSEEKSVHLVQFTEHNSNRIVAVDQSHGKVESSLLPLKETELKSEGEPVEEIGMLIHISQEEAEEEIVKEEKHAAPYISLLCMEDECIITEQSVEDEDELSMLKDDRDFVTMNEQPLACSTPIYATDESEDQFGQQQSYDDSVEDVFGEQYEAIENIITHDISDSNSALQESSEISQGESFYNAEAEIVATRAVAEIEDLDDCIISPRHEQVVEEFTQTEREATDKADFSLLRPLKDQKEETLHFQDQISPPPTIIATEFVAHEEEEGSEEEYIPNFDHPRTYLVESKELVIDRASLDSQSIDTTDSSTNIVGISDAEDPSVISIGSEMSEAIVHDPEQQEVLIFRQLKDTHTQDNFDVLEEKEDQEMIRRKHEGMEEAFLQEEIDAQITDRKVSENSTVIETQHEEERIKTTITTVVEKEEVQGRISREGQAITIMQEDELHLEDEGPIKEDIEVLEALTEEDFRSEQSSKSDDHFDGTKETIKKDDTLKEEVYQEEVEISNVGPSHEHEASETHHNVPADLYMTFSEEIEVEKVPIAKVEPLNTFDHHDDRCSEEEQVNDVYIEEVEIKKIDDQCDNIFEEEVEIREVDGSHQNVLQSETNENAILAVYEEQLEVVAEEKEKKEKIEDESEGILLAEPLTDGSDTEEEQGNVFEDLEEIICAEPVDEMHEDDEEGAEHQRNLEEYQIEEEDHNIPQEIEGTEEQTDANLYDNNNNQPMTRYYVDFSPGGSFERDSTASEEGEYPEVYRQGEPIEEDMEEFILVKYGEHSHSESSAEEDLSDHREMYVIPEEDSEENNRVHEQGEQRQEENGKTVFYEQGFVNPALEDIREEDEEEKEKASTYVDFEEKRQLEEYERLESFVILEEKLSQVESDEEIEELTSDTDKKRSSSDETLNDVDDLAETLTNTSSTLKEELILKELSEEESGGELERTLTETEEVIDLEDGGVLSKRTTREETCTVEEDNGSDDSDDDDKDKTLTRKRVSKKVITTTTTSATHVTTIPSEDQPRCSDNEKGPDFIEVFHTKKTESIDNPDEKSTPENTSSTETAEETIELEDGGVVSKLVTREETCTFEDDEDEGEDNLLTKKTATRKIITTTTTTTSRTTQLTSDQVLRHCPEEDDNSRVEDSTSSETHETVIKSRQSEEDRTDQSPKRQDSSANFSETCTPPLKKRRGFHQYFDSHDSEGHSSEGISSTTDSTGESPSVSGEDHVSDEDYAGLDEFQRECIRQHNIYRHQHRACRLVWSDHLAKAASAWADHLAASHTLEHSIEKEFGENLACAKGYDLRGDKVAEMWYDEIKEYNFETPAYNTKCGHFTQIIWRDTKEFGVAKSTAQDGVQYVVARYFPPGNVVGEFKNSIRRARGQRSSVRKRRRSSTRRKTSETDGADILTKQEKFKNECVVSHNYYRSLHGSPALQWSTRLSIEAQSFAEKLVKSGSFMHSGDKDVGECLAFSFGLELSGRDAVDSWYDEIVDYDYEFPGFTSHTANFTQLVWKATKEFGMGKAIGEDGSCVMVGRYYPPGNQVGEFQENVKQKQPGYF